MTHQQKMEEKVEAFKAAMERFIATLEGGRERAQPPEDGGWNAAQVGWHIARSNELLSGALTGAVPMAQPLPAEFQEDQEIFSKFPAKVQTFPQLEPPDGVTLSDALASLRASIDTTVGAFRSLTEERAKGHFVQFPMGPLTMYQFADFTVAHVSRHQQQLERCLE